MNELLSNSEHSPSDDDLLDSQEIQQPTPTIARAQTYERKLKSSWKIGRVWLIHMRPRGGPYTWSYELLCM